MPSSYIEMAGPNIPFRTSSLNFTAEEEEELNRLHKIKTERNSKLSLINAKSSVQDFISSKTDNLEAEIRYKSRSRELYRAALEQGIMTQEAYKDTVGSLDSVEERELVQIKRQKKMLLEDLQDIDMSATGKQPRKKKFNQKGFKAAVLTYYNVGKPNDARGYCHVLGWIRVKEIKTAHIVPKSLGGEEVSHLFGYSAEIVSDPRNGLTLHQGIEEALDAGNLVIVPEMKDQEIIWRIVVTMNKDLMKQEYFDLRKWEDIDGKKLVFLSENRPARRFLYLRFVITYLNCQKEGRMDWVERIKAKGHIWATPGPYLGRSMLIELSRRVSDVYLPEAFYDRTTFEGVDEERKVTEEEEETLAMSLKVKMREEEEANKRKTDYDSSDDETSDDDHD